MRKALKPALAINVGMSMGISMETDTEDKMLDKMFLTTAWTMVTETGPTIEVNNL
jgi:hypothetical protein